MGIFKKLNSSKKAVTNGTQTVAKHTVISKGMHQANFGVINNLYDSTAVRTAVNCIAKQISKAMPTCTNETLQHILLHPYDTLTLSQWLAKISTIYSLDNCCVLVPIYDILGMLTGILPIRLTDCRLDRDIETDKILMTYYINNVAIGNVEYDKVGMLLQHSYTQYLCNNNDPIYGYGQLTQAISESLQNTLNKMASIRFTAQTDGLLADADVQETLSKFNDLLDSNNNNGVLVYDETLKSVNPIYSKPVFLQSDQMDAVNRVIYNYFGVSDHIINGTANSTELNAFYDFCIEPILVQLSQVVTQMIGVDVAYSASKLQYCTTQEKVQMITALFDRGYLTKNEGNDILGIPRVTNGDTYYIRKDYVAVKDKPAEVNTTLTETEEKVGD